MKQSDPNNSPIHSAASAIRQTAKALTNYGAAPQVGVTQFKSGQAAVIPIVIRSRFEPSAFIM